MSDPKLHHYVPQFYLRRFTDSSGRLWVWDRDRDRIFQAQPNSVAAQNHFYRLTELIEDGHDPLEMEKQFSDLEGDVATITDQWLGWLRGIEPGTRIEIPDANREIVSLYIALQFLRTDDARQIISALVAENFGATPSPEEARRLHANILWDDETFSGIADRIRKSTWVFARNTTPTPFVTSDNPVAFRTGDNRMWVKVGYNMPGTYVVFPLAPDVVMYCHPVEPPWDKLARFDGCLSPVRLTDGMVRGDNTGQVFMASRFVISSDPNFDHERDFAKSIGTDRYAPRDTTS